MNASNRIVLVIDDDAIDRERVVRWLGRRFAVCQASTGRLGLDAAERLQPGCVLLDNHLTDTTGVDVLPELVGAGHTVVMMTGQGDEEIAAKAILEGAFDYLPKSRVTEEALTSVVERAIENRAASQRLGNSDRELGDLLGVAACEAHPVLESAMARCRAAAEELDGHSPPARQLADALAEMETLHGYLGELARFASAAEEQDWDAVDLREVAADVLGELDLPPAVRVEAADLPIVHGSRPALHELLRGVLLNAVRCGRAELSSITASSSREGRLWILALADDGGGAPETLDGSVRLPRPHGDRGWGLALATLVARQHGGDLWGHAEPGHGTTVYVSLPAADR